MCKFFLYIVRSAPVPHLFVTSFTSEYPNDFHTPQTPNTFDFLPKNKKTSADVTYRIIHHPLRSTPTNPLREKKRISLNFKQLHMNENESRVKINITFP